MSQATEQAPTTIATAKVSPIINLAKRFSVDAGKLLGVLRGTVIKPDKNGRQATDEEMAAFCIIADQYGLNPFTREIHAFTDGSRGVVPIVGIDGWAHIVNSSPAFDGCEFEEQADTEGRPIAIACRMFVKGRSRPVSVIERFSECKRNTPPWSTMPWRMLRHKAYMQAARIAFGLSGIYDEDEARDIEVSAKVISTTAAMPAKRQSLRVGASQSNGNGAAGHEEPAVEAEPAGIAPRQD